MQPINPGKTVDSLTTGEGRPESSLVTCTADAAGSLNNKYVTFRNAANAAFYAWLNINSAGVDPAPGGTGIEVAAATGASATVIATALQAAVDAHADFVASKPSATVVRIVNATDGAATDVGAGNSPFTVAPDSQGQAAVFYPALNPGSLSLNPSP